MMNLSFRMIFLPMLLGIFCLPAIDAFLGGVAKLPPSFRSTTTRSTLFVSPEQPRHPVQSFPFGDDFSALESMLAGQYASAPISDNEELLPSSLLGSLSEENLDELKKLLQDDRLPFERDSYWSKVRKHVTEATSMPPEGFRSSEFYEKEKQSLFAKTWQVVRPLPINFETLVIP